MEFRSGTNGFRIWFLGEDCDFFFFTALSLSCGTQDLFIVRAGLVAPWQVGSWFPNQGSNLPRLHWKEDSYLLDHQGSPSDLFLKITLIVTLFKITVIY